MARLCSFGIQPLRQKKATICSTFRIERGATSPLDPHVSAIVTPYIADDLPEPDLKVQNVVTVKPEHRFWDKSSFFMRKTNGMSIAESFAVAATRFHVTTVTSTGSFRQKTLSRRLTPNRSRVPNWPKSALAMFGIFWRPGSGPEDGICWNIRAQSLTGHARCSPPRL
jgi:hypothetical protein